jgi:hypothetical protein
MAKGDLRASDNHLHPRESLPGPSQKVKGALDVPQIQSAADDVRLPVEDLLQKGVIVEFFLLRAQPSLFVVRGKTGALQCVKQVTAGQGQIFSGCRVVLQARQLEEKERLDRLSVLHNAFFYLRSVLPTNDATGLRPVEGKGPSGKVKALGSHLVPYGRVRLKFLEGYS